MSNFIHFNDIDIHNELTWKNKFMLTFDIDWVDDHILDFLLNEINKINVKVTLFVTHKTKYLDVFRKHENIELGIHPNFNSCFESEQHNVESILDQILNIVPEATVSRSHSLTTSGRWLELYKNKGIKYLSNYMMEWQTNIRPFNHINQLIEVPIFFADDGLIYNTIINENVISNVIKKSKNFKESVKVFNFHPIHLYLNSTSYNYYTENKEKKIKNTSNLGITQVFKELIKELNNVSANI
ncbi:hypothetical protein DID74_00285 [Candidatus Marinamargulisbacteria bacterium SCGC AG-333-B06]|nr:hypothetical protein DID74_00285 [Candidatus Marinamargulisbacteria bacterium SCGC AG-333-B06]